MFERFTSHARSAVVHAQEEARRWIHHPCIGTEHVLVGLLVEPVGAGGRALQALGLDLGGARDELAALYSEDATEFGPSDVEALRTLGIDFDEVRRTVEDSFGPGALESAERRRLERGHIPFSSRAKKALELSLREALRLGDRHIGTGHLLLGLLRDDDRSGASRILRAKGIDPARVRDEVLAEIQRGGDRPGRTA